MTNPFLVVDGLKNVECGESALHRLCILYLYLLRILQRHLHIARLVLIINRDKSDVTFCLF